MKIGKIKTIIREDLIGFLNDSLKINEFDDVSANGLQMQGTATIGTVGFAVDACLPVYSIAKNSGVDFLITHHGLFWGVINSIQRRMYGHVKALIDANLNLYAVHLPLDAHPEVGNNAQIMEKIIQNAPSQSITPFGIGFSTKMQITLSEIVGRLQETNVKFIGDIQRKVGSLAVISGAGGSYVQKAIDQKIECLITGEISYPAYHLAEEENLSIITLGHYESERYGLKALETLVKNRFGIKTVFIDYMPRYY